ncbi:MAG TPA: hypothetical protein VFT51_15430 [Bacillales bacterium]|nr:hypothetical protein [Bacillales bacterium]
MAATDLSVKDKSRSALRFHPVQFIDKLHPSKPVLRVKNRHFEPVSVEYSLPNHSAVFAPTSRSWHEAGEEDILRFKEGVQIALYVLYALNVSSGQCVVQRESVRDYSVYQITGTSSLDWNGDPENDQKARLLSYGADVECMVRNQKTGRWVSASSIMAENGTIGYDDTIAVNGKKVLRPILELRPQPAATARQLHRNLYDLYVKLESYLAKNYLQTVGSGFGRFHVGGHLHVGQQPLTFQHVRNLDVFLAIPFALLETGDSRQRRRQFGKLGSARPNAFSGFEYRTLPSWYAFIPDLLPVLEWFCYINEHPDTFPTLNFSSKMLRGYYWHSIRDLTEVSKKIELICRDSLPSEDFNRYAVPFFRLIHRKEGVI